MSWKTSTTRKRLWIVIRPLVIFAPLIITTTLLVRFNSGSSNLLLSFNRIYQNNYIVNDVLLAFIVASYAVVFVGLCFYFWEAISDLFKHSGERGAIKACNTISLALLFAVGITLIGYLAIMFITCIGGWSEELHEFFDIDFIVLLNKCLSFGIFFIFFIADILSWVSQRLQQKDCNDQLGNSPDDTNAKDSLGIASEQIEISKNVTLLVNVPTVLLTGCILLLTAYLGGAGRFRGAVDPQLHFMEFQQRVRPGVFHHLFLNGLETGVIVATIIYSQIVYLVIKTKSDLR
jgi:hypothetical protein